MTAAPHCEFICPAEDPRKIRGTYAKTGAEDMNEMVKMGIYRKETDNSPYGLSINESFMNRS